MSIFSTPKPPTPPKPTAATSQTSQDAVRINARKRGLAGSIATSGLGVPGEAPINAPSLYGLTV